MTTTSTIAETAEHRIAAGWKGGPGECGVECACGVTFDGFDSLAEANELLERHIVEPNPAPVESKPAPDPRAEYVAGLRMLADLLEAHPHLELPFQGRLSPMDIWVAHKDDQSVRLAEWAKLLPGRKTKREAGEGGQWFCLVANLRGLKIEVTADRDEVCQKVVVGTREVTEEVPDPEALAAVPKVKQTKVVEEIEWRCGSILGDRDDELAEAVSA